MVEDLKDKYETSDHPAVHKVDGGKNQGLSVYSEGPGDGGGGVGCVQAGRCKEVGAVCVGRQADSRGRVLWCCSQAFRNKGCVRQA